MTALQSLSPHADKLAVLKQIHSAKVVTVTSNTALPFPHHLEGDGLVTDCPAIALGVLTADCAPALFYGRKASGAPVIGAAHAGWGGALTGILGNTIQAMLALGAEKQTIHAAIGPCIAQDSYEVDMDFKAPFLAQNAETERFFKFATNNDEKAYFDLKGYNIWRMIEAGLEPQNIFVSSIDTYTDKDSYFSHRRATHEGAPQAEGRQISLIYI